MLIYNLLEGFTDARGHVVSRPLLANVICRMRCVMLPQKIEVLFDVL
jgi:hypothetical protein